MEFEESHLFTDAEVAKALYPWGLVTDVEPRPFDLDRCVERYVRGLPRRAETTAHPWRDDFTRELRGKRGVVTAEEAAFWFAALTNPARLYDDREQQHTVVELAEFTGQPSPHEVRVRMDAWYLAFTEHYRNVRFYTQAYLGRLMLPLIGLPATLEILLDTLDMAWVSPFLDQLYPSADDDLDAAGAVASQWLQYGLAAPAWQTDRHRHELALENAKERLLPLARPPNEVRTYLVEAAARRAKPTASLYHVLNAEPDDAAFLEYLEAFKPDLGRREVVLLIGRFGLDACEWITKRVRSSRREPSAGLTGALAKIRSPRAVPALIHLGTRPSTANEARAAFDKPDLPFAIGLAQAANGRTNARALAAELLARVEKLAPELYEAAMAAQPEEARAALLDRVARTVVERRPELDDSRWPSWMFQLYQEKRPAGLPRFCARKHLRPLYLADGEHEVPASIVWGLLVTLRDHGWLEKEARSALGTNIHVDLDSESVSEFSWSLFQSWMRSGFGVPHRWCLLQLAEFATDAQILDLADAIEEWPTLGQRERAYDGLVVLGSHASDTALAALNKLAHQSRFKGVRRHASHALTQLATRRGLTPGQLEDMIIDDCGLEEDGTATFDYGPRQFTLGFDEDFTPLVRAEDGKTTKSLPRRRNNDDEVLVKRERERFRTMKKRLGDVLKLQVRRLEAALGDQRRWAPDAWHTNYVMQPVMSHVVQRFLWGAYDSEGERVAAFRVTADRGLADLADENFEIPRACQISLIHPLELTQEDAASWGALFADYEVIPAFSQLDREIYEAPRVRSLTEFSEVSVQPGWLRGHFNRRGWSKSAPRAGRITSLYRDFHAHELRVYARLSPGLAVQNFRSEGEQRIEEVWFVRRQGWQEGEPHRMDQLPPVVVSEALRDVHLIVDRARH